MSVRCISWVWEHSRAQGGTLLVALALADNAHDDGVCWPGIDYLAAKCRISVRSVTRHVHELEKLGELEIEHRGLTMTNRYRLTLIGQSGRSEIPDRTPAADPELPQVADPGMPQVADKPSGNRKMNRKGSTRLPESWLLNDERIADARRLTTYTGSRIQHEWQKFANTEFPAPRSDWAAAWRKWLLKAIDYDRERGISSAARQADRQQAERATRATARPPAAPTRLGDVLKDVGL